MKQNASSPLQTAKNLFTHPQGLSSLFACDNLKVLRLKGTAKERARLHGERLGKELTKDVLLYFAGKTREPLMALPWPLRPALQRPFVKWLRGLQENAPAELREEARALAAGAGLTDEDILMAVSGPDLATLANAWQLNPKVAWARMRFGCTTVSGKNKHGDFALARNLDFPGVGRFDKNPLVIVHQSTEPGELKRIALGADGVHFASVSAINEAGIGLVVHQNFTHEASPRSVPLLFIGDLVLRKAKSVSEAIELVKSYPPGPMWTFVFFDLRTGETVAVEASKTRHGIRRVSSGSCFSQANHCLSDEGSSAQFSSHGTYINSCRRLDIVAEMTDHVAHTEGEIAPHFAKVLAARSEKWAPELSVFDDIIKPITIQSVIFERASDAPASSLGRMWVSCDLAPSASGRYVGFDLDQLFSDNTTEAPQFAVRDFIGASREEREHQMRAAQASRLSFDERRDAEALELVKDQKSPGGLLMRATLCYRTKRFDEAARLMSEALAFEVPRHIRQSMMWLQALSLLSLGMKSEAQAIAKELASQNLGNRPIASAVERLATGGRLGSHERAVIYDFFAGDLVTPPQR